MCKTLKNNGFSLVELVIVIAIMAILVALLAPQYIKYVEKSRLTTDEEVVNSVHDAIAVAIADENIEERPVDGFSPTAKIRIEDIGVTTDKTYTEFVGSIKSFLQVEDLAIIKNKLNSKSYKGQDIMVEIKAGSQSVIVSVSSNDISAAGDLIIR